MATPSAILNVLLKADTADATAKLSKYDKQLAAVDAKTRKGIETRLSGTYNPKAFEQYTAALDKAAARAKNREAFKAELGANFNNRAFNQYQRALEKSEVQTAKADATTKHFNGSLNGLTTTVKYAAIGLGVFTAGVAAASVKLSVDFDQAMRNVNSIAQLSEKQFKSLEQRVLGLAKTTAQTPKTLAEGLYDLVSSGFKANDAIKVLAASAKAATAGLTDTKTSTAAVAAVLNAYHRPASDAAKVSDTLFKTVDIGVISFEQLANTIGDVLPFAAQLHVSLNQVGAAVATMTKAGISPAETMTRIKNVFVALLKPSKDLSKAIKETGAASGEALIHQRGLQGALEAIIKTTDGSKGAVARLFPNIRALGGALALTGINAKGADRDVKAFSNTVGATNLALSQQAKSAAYQWQQLKATLAAVAIQFGSVLLPILNKAFQAIGSFVKGMVDGTGAGGRFVATMQQLGDTVKGVFDQFQHGNPYIVAAVGAITGLLVAFQAAKALAALAVVVAAIGAPIVLVVAGIGALVGALTLLYLKNKTVHDFINAAWNDIKNVAQAVFPTISTIVKIMVAITKVQFDLLKAYATAVFTVISGLIKVTLIPAFNLIKPVLQKLGDLFRIIWGGIRGAVKGAMDFILGAFATFLHVAADIANVKLPFLGKVFGKTGDAIESAANNVDDLRRQLDGLPAKKNTTVDVKVDFFSNVAGAINSIGQAVANGLGNVGNLSGGGSNIGRRAVGGMIDQPMIMVGEEAPQHPEVVLATNPAYRNRNLGLWAQAGKMLGVPGFAKGGLANAGNMVHEIDPWTASTAGSWMKGKAGAWASKLMGKVGGQVGGGAATGAQGPVPPGTVRDWLTTALKITNHFSPANLAALYSRTIQESGGNPNAINLWDSNAKAGHPSKGLLQTIDSTFSQYALPGLGGIYNPIANAVAAIRYMFARYGHIVGASSSGYAKGGIVGKIRGYAKGGLVSGYFNAAGKPTFPSAYRAALNGGGAPLVSAASVLKLPPLPTLPGGVPDTVGGLRQLGGQVGGARSTISKLEQSFGAIDNYYSSVAPVGDLIDPVTGARNEKAISERLKQLNILIAYRQHIFDLWSRVVVLTQRLIEANKIVAAGLSAKLASLQESGSRLRNTLAHISTKGLKGSALKNANKRIADIKKAITGNDKLIGDTKGDIAKYMGNARSAQGDLTSATGDRMSAWTSLQALLGEKFGVAGTVAQTTTDTGTVGGGLDTTGGFTDTGVSSSDQSASLLASLLQTAQQNYAVSQAQYSVLQKFPAFGGSFAQGGVVPGPIGQPRTIIAHGGETVTPHGGHSVRVELHDHRTRVFVNDVEQVVQSSGRRDARNASRNLAGSRRRIGGL